MPKPKKTPDIISAIRHRDLFGSLPAFQSLDSWTGWLVWLKAVFALSMDDADLAIYRQCTGRTDTPTALDPDEVETGFDIPLINARFSIYRPSTNLEDDPPIVAPPMVAPSEVYTIVGRRGGKSFISALTAVYVACFGSYKRHLNVGEKATVLVLARDRDQAKIVFGYISGLLREIPPLYGMVEVERADEIELNNQVMIAVKTSDYRAIRGLTVACCILDEVAFWDSGGISPDREVLTALRPSMSTIPNAKILGAISTPYSQSGVLYESYREHYGKTDDHVLVWVAPTTVLNPTIDRQLIDREMAKDPEGASAEWLARFREDLESAFSLEAIETCVVKGRDELPSSSAIRYHAFCDPSGGRHDSFTLSIAHKEADKVVVDCIADWRAPFNPHVVSAELSNAQDLRAGDGSRRRLWR